jgi:hypothetical protein
MSLITEAGGMALTNSERQSRWRARLKEAASGADPGQAAENAALRAKVAALEAALARTAPGRSQRGTRAQAAELDEWIDAEVRRRLREAVAARDAADTLAVEQANDILSRATGRHTPPFNPQEYHVVLWALHPDNKDQQKTAEAFILVRQKKHILCDAGPIQRRDKGVEPLPKTVDDLLARRRTKKR